LQFVAKARKCDQRTHEASGFIILNWFEADSPVTVAQLHEVKDQAMFRSLFGTVAWESFVALSLAVLVAAAATAAESNMDLPDLVRQRASLDYRNTPRRVMAFYYPWYGLPDGPGGEGRTIHWGRIDAQNKNIEASTNYPAIGAYDSHDPDLIARHCRWAREAGIDTLIVSWWGHGEYSDVAVPLILDACQAHGLSVTLYYETCPNPKTPQATARDLARIVKRYGSHSAYLKANGKPVIFVYVRAVQQLGLTGWLRTATLLSKDPETDAALIGDNLSFGAAHVFDGIHTYNTAGQIRQKSVDAVRDWAGSRYPQWVRMSDRFDRISTLTLIPGYDDTKIRKPGLAVPRHDGRSYAAQWEQAIEADPHWVLITSFNEWHEGSEIEPSAEFGRAYLDATAAYAKRFKSQPLRPHKPAPAPDGVSKARLARLRERLAGKPIGVLPNPESRAFWFLAAGVQADVRGVTWRDVSEGDVTPEHYPILLHAGDESYRTTVKEKDDVDAGLAAYLKAGGFLVVMPSKPLPFYRDAEGRPVARADRFALTLRHGWEKPPEEQTLTFVQPESRLPHVPKSFPFPADGDRRWRPFVRGEHKQYVPLLRLSDGAGKALGDGVVYAEPNTGGRVLFVWFRLLDGPHAEALLYDVLAFVAGHK
jgi:hypothetical protein